MRVGRGVGVRVGLLTTSLAALLAVAGCDGGEESTDPPSSSETTTAEETSTEPTTPPATPPEVEVPTPAPEASVNDHVGAIWATRYFLDLYTYMRQSGDTTQFEAMSGSDCEYCASSLANATEIHEGGGWVEGGSINFALDEAVAEYPTEEEPSYLVRFEVEQEAQQIYRGDGSVDEVATSSGSAVVALLYANGRFVVEGVNLERA